MTPEEFRRAGHALVDWIADYRERLARGEDPVQARTRPGELVAQLPTSAPESPEPFTQVLEDLTQQILPGITHWQHPNFYGYFPSGGSLAGVLGDMASAGLAVIGLNWQASPALTELEQVTTDWLRDLLGVPNSFRGVIQDTASTASFLALVCARERTTNHAQTRGGLQEAGAPLTVYTSVHAHSSIEKAALLAGIGRENVRAVPVDAAFRLDPTALAAAIAADRAAGKRPCAIVANSGTTLTTAFDPIAPLVEIARRESMWLHVDAAMGGAAMILPEFRHHWAGIEGVDSIVVNPHKWLTVSFDCSLYLVRDAEHLVRVMSTNPSYLQTTVDQNVRNYRDWGLALGRRFRALKVWMVLRDRGAASLREKLRRDLSLAARLEHHVRSTPPWSVVAPVALQTVCVRHEPPGLTGESLDAHTRRWAQAINDSGRAYVTPAVLEGRWMVRISIGAEGTTEAHIDGLWETLQATAEASAAA
jgi:aromatic-L-amino-acid/L-tryptophan decarboxylase